MKTVYTCEDCVSFDTENIFCDFLCIDCSNDSAICPFFFSNSYYDRKVTDND